MYSANTKPKKKLTQKHLLISLIVICLLAVGGAYYYHKAHATSLTTPDGKKVSLTPATPAEKQAADDNKQAIIDKQAAERSTPSNTNTLKQVSPVITSADSTTVRGYISGVFEDGGTCTATATSGSKTYTKTSTGFENVSNTQCAPITWNTPLGAGTWSITLSYSSSSANGSVTKSVDIR